METDWEKADGLEILAKTVIVILTTSNWKSTKSMQSDQAPFVFFIEDPIFI